MAESARYQSFVSDKQGFFSTAMTADTARLRAESKDYSFIAPNRLLIEQEFNQLFTTLKKNGKDRQQFWLYCYYSSLMLEAYYRAYGKLGHAQSYQDQAAQILHRVQTGSFPREINEDTYVQALRKKIVTDLGKLVSTPLHTTKIRDWISFANITRLQLVFSKITVKTTLAAAQELRWIEKLDALLGWHTDVDGLVSSINSTNAVFNFLSVGIFAARFILNAGLVLKHTLCPSDEENMRSMTERFADELNKRYCDFANDGVWFIVNGLTNYAPYFGISAPVATGATAVFLLFDAALLYHRKQLVERDYLTKSSQYLSELTDLQKEWQRVALEEGADLIAARIMVLEEQLAELALNWQTTNATYWCNITAALLLFGGFSAGLALAAPLAAISFLVCAVGAATYISADLYGEYFKKGLLVQQAEQLNKDSTVAKAERDTALNEFAISMTKNTVIPMMVVATFAVSWPAALLFSALYLGYECGKGYLNLLPPPAEDPTPSALTC